MAEKKPLIDLIGKLQGEVPASAPKAGPRFGELGLLAEIQNLKELLDERQGELDAIEAQMSQLTTERDALSADIDALRLGLDETVSALTARAEAAEDAQRAANEALAAVQGEQRRIEEQISRRDMEIAKLTHALREAEDMPAVSFVGKEDLEAQLADAQVEIERLSESVSARFREVAMLTRRLEEESREGDTLVARPAKAATVTPAPGKKSAPKKEKGPAVRAKEGAASSTAKPTASSAAKTPAAKPPAAKKTAPKVDPDADEVLFLVKGQLSPLQLVHFLRIAAGLAERGKRTGMWFADQTWAADQKSIGYLRKAANIRIHPQLPPLAGPGFIMVLGTESGLVLRFLGSERIVDESGALAFDGTAEPIALSEVALLPQLAPYLDALRAIKATEDLLVTREAMPGLTQLAPKNLHYIPVPAVDGAPGALIIVGRTPSDEDMMDIALLARTLGRPFRWAATTPKSALSGYLTTGQPDDMLKESQAAAVGVPDSDITPVPREQLLDSLLKTATGAATLDTSIRLPVGAHFPFPQVS